jgi:hypothetical protein
VFRTSVALGLILLSTLTAYWGVTDMFEELQAYIARSQERRADIQQKITEQRVEGMLNAYPSGNKSSRGMGASKANPVGGVPKKGKISLEELVKRIAAKESGGNYQALGQVTGGDRAYGKYQIMGNNIPSWTQQYLGKTLTPQQFLNRENAQDKVAMGKLKYYYKRYGPGGAAASWYAGESAAKGWKDYKKSNYSDNGTEYPSVYEYVRDILRGN